MAPKAKRPPRRFSQEARESRRWDDPDSDDGAGEEEEDKCHPQTDQGLNEDGQDDESEDMNGSDSEDGGDLDAELRAQAPRKRAAAKALARGAAEAEGLWDPLADLGPRKKRKTGPAAGKGQPAGAPAREKAAAAAAGDPGVFRDLPSWTSTFGFPEGSAVCLVNLQKAPQLNGQHGTIGAALDRATGRVQVIMRDGTVKSLKQDNLREVFTGAVVRIHGLQGAAELNGRIAECGDLDLASGRYSVRLADAAGTTKKIKETNLELVRRFVVPLQMLSVQRPPFAWSEELRRAGAGDTVQHRPWAEQLRRLFDIGLPAPRLLAASALAILPEGVGQEGAGYPGVQISADKVPTDDDGKAVARVLAVSVERDTCVPGEPLGASEFRRIVEAAKALHKHDPSLPTFFLLPQTCVKPLPILRSSASCAWPLYLQMCQALVCLDTPHRPHKAWCRCEALIVGVGFSKPVYMLSRQGEVVVGGHSSAWLLSDRAEEASIAAPADGQVVPAERPLLEKLAAEALTDASRRGAKVTVRFVSPDHSVG